MWLPELFAAGVLRWTGSEYVSLALTDVVGALIGLLGVVWLGRALCIGLLAAGLAALTYALSPILAEHMWRNQLHAQAIGSASWSAAATASLLLYVPAATRFPRDLVRHLLPRAALLGLVWLGTSWHYQYHFVVIPASLVFVAADRATSLRRLAVWRGGVAALVTLTLLSAALLAAHGMPVIPENNDPRNAVSALLPALLSDDPARVLPSSCGPPGAWP